MLSSRATLTSTKLQYVLTICESTTGRGHATMVPCKETNPEAVKAITRFIVENGLHIHDSRR
eukprot:2362450-Amphidinium_carterae.2